MMTDNLRDLFPEDISDEAVYHLGNFLYELAQTFESIHLGQIMRYSKSRIELSNELMKQNSDESMNAEKELQDSPF
jgi:hypothetical protein